MAARFLQIECAAVGLPARPETRLGSRKSLRRILNYSFCRLIKYRLSDVALGHLSLYLPPLAWVLLYIFFQRSRSQRPRGLYSGAHRGRAFNHSIVVMMDGAN